MKPLQSSHIDQHMERSCMCVFMDLQAHLCLHVLGGQRTAVGVTSQDLASLLFEVGSLIGLELCD